MKMLKTAASETEISETRESLLSASVFSWDFVVMNCLAATLATYGLFANNSTAIIGAMLIAMLFSPISSLALGIVDSDLKLISKSLLTLAGGILIVCATAAIWSRINFRLPSDTKMNRESWLSERWLKEENCRTVYRSEGSKANCPKII